MADVARLDFTQEPPGTSEHEIRLDRHLILDPVRARQERWTRYRAVNPPPGLRPHPWASIGAMFAHAFVTPSGFTILETVGVARALAFAAAWRWYGICLDVANSGKLPVSWPEILDAHPSDIFGRINNSVIAEEASHG